MNLLTASNSQVTTLSTKHRLNKKTSLFLCEVPAVRRPCLVEQSGGGGFIASLTQKDLTYVKQYRT